MRAIAKSRYFWRSAAQGVKHAPFVHFIAVLTLTIALFSAGLARAATRWVDALLASLGGDVRVTVYLADDAIPAQAEEIARTVMQKSGGDAVVVTPAEALSRLAQQIGPAGGALHELPDNPLPYSVELSLPDARRAPAALKALVADIRAIPGVADVDYGQEAIERLSAIATALRVGSWIALVVVAVATVVIVSATLQLAIYARREEIEIQKLVGATDRFVKAPFLIEGLIQGLIGALVAVISLWSFSLAWGPRLTELFGFLVGPHGAPRLIDLALASELLAAGCVLGLGGSFVAVGRFLRV